MGRAQVAVSGMRVTAEDDSVRLERDGEKPITVRFASHSVSVEYGNAGPQFLKLRRPKTVDEVRADLARLKADMCEFLIENRSMNEAQGLPLVGPAAISISEDILGLMKAAQSITSPKA